MINEADKLAMLSLGEWIPENPARKIAGFHINEIYSVWSTWAEMAEGFVNVKNSPEHLKTWINTALAQQIYDYLHGSK